MSCGEIRPYLQAFVDDELSPERSIDVGRHLADCPECAAEVELTRHICRATRKSLSVTPLCPNFQSRLCQGLSEERKRQELGFTGKPLSYWVTAPLAFAAAVALFFGARFRAEEKPDVNLASQDHLVDFLVDRHATQVEPDARDARTVLQLEPELGFPVRAPNLDRFGAHFEGANLVPVDRTQVAMLRYTLAGRRVTLYMYDPDELPMRAVRELEPSVVGSRAVFIGKRRGYSIATCDHEGVGYAVTGDLTSRESAELVAAAY